MSALDILAPFLVLQEAGDMLFLCHTIFRNDTARSTGRSERWTVGHRKLGVRPGDIPALSGGRGLHPQL